MSDQWAFAACLFVSMAFTAYTAKCLNNTMELAIEMLRLVRQSYDDASDEPGRADDGR